MLRLDLLLRVPDGSGVPSLGVPAFEFLPPRTEVGVDRPDDGADLFFLSNRFLRGPETSLHFALHSVGIHDSQIYAGVLLEGKRRRPNCTSTTAGVRRRLFLLFSLLGLPQLCPGNYSILTQKSFAAVLREMSFS